MMEVKVLAVAVNMTIKDNEVFRYVPAGHNPVIKWLVRNDHRRWSLKKKIYIN